MHESGGNDVPVVKALQERCLDTRWTVVAIRCQGKGYSTTSK